MSDQSTSAQIASGGQEYVGDSRASLQDAFDNAISQFGVGAKTWRMTSIQGDTGHLGTHWHVHIRTDN